MKITLSNNETLVLRTCRADGTSTNNFRWPKRGPVKCPDWNPTPQCGGGLHGALMGQGSGGLFNWNSDALWQVVKVKKDEIVDLGGKVKFPRGYVMFTGDRKTATEIIYAHGGKTVIGGTQIVGDKQAATAGDYGTAIAGDCGMATAGYYGTATAGDRGIATARYYGTATVGNNGTATVGNNGTATAGNGGTATAGNCGTATVGNNGTATAGYDGAVTAGNNGTVMARYGGAAAAGINGKICIHYYDGVRYRLALGYIGENGLEPNVKYRVDNAGKFVKISA